MLCEAIIFSITINVTIMNLLENFLSIPLLQLSITIDYNQVSFCIFYSRKITSGMLILGLAALENFVTFLSLMGLDFSPEERVCMSRRSLNFSA